MSPSFGRDVKLGVPCLDAACIVGLNRLKKLGITAYSKGSKQKKTSMSKNVAAISCCSEVLQYQQIMKACCKDIPQFVTGKIPPHFKAHVN